MAFLGKTDEVLSIKAYAKINLYLDVTSRYPDGYHQIESVMQSVSLCDVIEIQLSQDIDVTCTNNKLSGKDNLAYRAAELLKTTTGLKVGAAINIAKRIPIAAGLAGGSADAAATLAGLNILWGLNLSLAELQVLGLKLGADIPFCLSGGTMLAEGKGEKLTPLKPLPDFSMVLITPSISVSTAEIYRGVDEQTPSPLRRKDKVTESISIGSAYQLVDALGNLLETIALKRYPIISAIKKLGLDLGGIGALMSGSGPTVFVICQDEQSAETIANAVRSYDPTFFVEIVKPVSRGVEVL